MRFKKTIFFSVFLVFIFLLSTSHVSAAAIMWGKTELKPGQLGKVTILSDTRTSKQVNSNTLQPDKVLKKGGEFRVYTYREFGGKGYYGVGGGLFVQKDSSILYETPSKARLAMVKNQNRPLAEVVALSETAKRTDQIVTVIASGTNAKVSLFEKDGNQWKEVNKADGFVGQKGIGQVKEGSRRTPKGSYSLGFAFGTSDPGTKLPFRKITPNSYWISNVKDPQYNTWQERRSSSSKDEHLIKYKVAYEHAIVIDYDNGVGGGSAFFLHVSSGRPTLGCVAIPKNKMVQFMKEIEPRAHIINVNHQYEIANY